MDESDFATHSGGGGAERASHTFAASRGAQIAFFFWSLQGLWRWQMFQPDGFLAGLAREVLGVDLLDGEEPAQGRADFLLGAGIQHPLGLGRFGLLGGLRRLSDLRPLRAHYL